MYHIKLNKRYVSLMISWLYWFSFYCVWVDTGGGTKW